MSVRVYHLGVSDDAERLELEAVQRVGDRATYRVARSGDEVPVEVDVVRLGSGFHVAMGQRGYRCDVIRDGDRTHVVVGGQSFEVPLLDERRYRRLQRSGGATAEGGPDLLSPMAGKVVALSVQPGDVVVQGQGLVILEAMKMENEINSSRDGVVEAVYVEVGQNVEPGAVLLRVLSAESEESEHDG